MIVQLDDDAKDAVLSLCQTDILGKLQALSIELDAKAGCSYVIFLCSAPKDYDRD